ncbi:MAG: hypothetical protein LBG20_01220 [Holosporaceae bacterium]|jgi:hypothetical protein|nr:hypothetical protein [Holosporaceae bacterium]
MKKKIVAGVLSLILPCTGVFAEDDEAAPQEASSDFETGHAFYVGGAVRLSSNRTDIRLEEMYYDLFWTPAQNLGGDIGDISRTIIGGLATAGIGGRIVALDIDDAGNVSSASVRDVTATPFCKGKRVQPGFVLSGGYRYTFAGGHFAKLGVEVEIGSRKTGGGLSAYQGKEMNNLLGEAQTGSNLVTPAIVASIGTHVGCGYIVGLRCGVMWDQLNVSWAGVNQKKRMARNLFGLSCEKNLGYCRIELDCDYVLGKKVQLGDYDISWAPPDRWGADTPTEIGIWHRLAGSRQSCRITLSITKNIL